MSLAMVAMLALVGCQLCDTGDKSSAPKPQGASLTAPAKPGVIGIAPGNASIRFTGSTAIMSQEGRFESFDGTLELPTPDPKDAKIHVKVDMSSTTTKVGLLTKHLKGEDFFDVAKYPTAEFSSERIVPTGNAGSYQVTGTFTLHGVSRSVTFPAQIVLKGDEVAFDATIPISQTSFGMTEAARKTKDEVPVVVSIRGLMK
jgi:polyisoprenoid-binding protein YceI